MGEGGGKWDTFFQTFPSLCNRSMVLPNMEIILTLESHILDILLTLTSSEPSFYSESVTMKSVLFNILSQLCLIQFQLSELGFKEKIIKNCPEMSLFVLKFVKHIMIAGVHVKLNVQLLSKHF